MSIFDKRELVEFILSLILTIIMTIMLISFIRKEWKNESQNIGFKCWKLPLHTLLALTSFIIYLLYTIYSNILSSYWIFYAKPNDAFYPPWCMAHFMHYSMYTYGKIAMYLFWFVRLHQVFESTFVAIPKRKLKALAIIFNIPIIITSTVLFIVTFPAYKHVVIPNPEWSLITSYDSCSVVNSSLQTKEIRIISVSSIGIFSLSETIYSVLIIRMFVSRIFKLRVFCQTLPLQQQSEAQNPNAAKNATFYLKVAIKTSNLLIFAIFTNYLLIIKYMLGLTDWVHLIDVFSNYLSMYLSFSFASKYYDFIFSPCNDLCYSCCVRLCYCCCLPKANSSASNQGGNPELRKKGLEIAASNSVVTKSDTRTRNVSTTIDSETMVAKDFAIIDTKQ